MAVWASVFALSFCVCIHMQCSDHSIRLLSLQMEVLFFISAWFFLFSWNLTPQISLPYCHDYHLKPTHTFAHIQNRSYDPLKRYECRKLLCPVHSHTHACSLGSQGFFSDQTCRVLLFFFYFACLWLRFQGVTHFLCSSCCYCGRLHFLSKEIWIF